MNENRKLIYESIDEMREQLPNAGLSSLPMVFLHDVIQKEFTELDAEIERLREELNKC